MGKGFLDVDVGACDFLSILLGHFEEFQMGNILSLKEKSIHAFIIKL